MSNCKKYILTIDQSTSASKILLFDKRANLVKRVAIPHQQFYPEPGFVEHDASEIFDNVIIGLNQVLNETCISTSEIASIAITNQRETSLIWDKITGIPIAKAAVWQCQRGKKFCDQLKKDGFDEMVKEKTGMIIDPYFSASKLQWILNNTEGAREKANNGMLALGTMDSWLLWKLSGGKAHITDMSNACRTLLFNINTLQWDKELLELFDLPGSMFPSLKYSNEIFGHSDTSVVFDEPIPISGLLGDSHAALFGHNCFMPGMTKVTYGTGSSIMMNIGSEPLKAPKGLVTSIGYALEGKIDYVFEGNIHSAGDTLNWIVNELQLIDNVPETEYLAKSIQSTNGVYLVPAFVGLGAPHWDNFARASLTGINRDTGKAHVVRAALESIAFQVKDLVDLMVKESGIQLNEIHVDGGPTRNEFLMQFQSDMLDKKVLRAAIEEISALGATFMAGLATGFWKNLDDIKSASRNNKQFSPKMNKEEREALYQGWQKAIQRTKL